LRSVASDAGNSGSLEDGADGTVKIAIFNPAQQTAGQAGSVREVFSRYTFFGTRFANELS
jgi:hypothetical protein